jgi:transcriptional regulator with XRE-family HTH domain
MNELGVNIKARRQALGLSLEALSEQSGVSRAMLSDIERGSKSPTVRVVSQIAEGLGCTVSQLLGDSTAEATQMLSLVRRSERRVLLDPQSGVERALLSPDFLRHGIEVLWYTIPPGADTGDFPAHRPGVEEQLTVIAGRMECRVGAQAVTLETGDSLWFQADVAHRLVNIDTEPCHCLLIIDASRARSRP